MNDERNESLGHSQVFKVSQVIQEDHHQLEFYYNKIINSNDPDEQKRYQNAFVWELARHSIAEELVVYPALERTISDGSGRAEKDRSQHQEKLSPSDEQFIPAIKGLWRDLSTHIKEEEEEDLVRLEEAISMTESKELASSFEKTKSFIPTRSHPNAPNKPPFETVISLM
ncbi:hypothetical protein SLS62_008762 [Diatrype stigma]|uniref:Hemerythrin-like domain-containing protein n=1 Tax=Diatrype stigma TaxID=117547 RepID=A0AAN9UI61_9PEZI